MTEMRKIMGIVETTLLEASFNYSTTSPDKTCIMFSAARRILFPSAVFLSNDGQTLSTTKSLTIILIASRKLEAAAKEIYKPETSDTFRATIKNIHSAFRNCDAVKENIALLRQHPEYFKFIELVGQDRIYRYLTTDLKMTEQAFVKLFGDPP